MEVKQLSLDSNNTRLTKKNSSISPTQKNLKKLIFQYHMKLKEQKDNMFKNNKNKDLILKIYKEKQNNLSLMTPFLKCIPKRRNDYFKEGKILKRKINNFLFKNTNSYNNEIGKKLNNFPYKRILVRKKNNSSNNFFQDFSLSINNSFNSDLMKSKLDFNEEKQQKKTKSIFNIYKIKKDKKKIDKKISRSTSLSERIDNNNFILPFVPIFKYSFSSRSERVRFEKNNELLSKLHFLINKYPNKKNKYVTEFFKEKLILEPEYYTTENINKFSDYLNNNSKEIDFREPLINIIKKCLNISIDKNYFSQSMKSIIPYKNLFKKLYDEKNKQINDFKNQKLSLENTLIINDNPMFSKNSIKDYNNEQIKYLKKEIKSIRLNSNGKECYASKLINKSYNRNETLREKKFEELAKKKHKLLEYIVLHNAQEQMCLRKDLHID